LKGGPGWSGERLLGWQKKSAQEVQASQNHRGSKNKNEKKKLVPILKTVETEVKPKVKGRTGRGPNGTPSETLGKSATCRGPREIRKAR